MQTFSAEELATMRHVSPQTVINWAKGGYPLDNGEKVPLPGADKSGRKWIFDKAKTLRFFENLRQQRWQTFTNQDTQTQRPARRKSLKSGHIGSRLEENRIEEALAKRLNLTH